MQSFFILSFLQDLSLGQFAQKFDESRLMSRIHWMFYSPHVGILVAFIISLTISIKKKRFWINSLLVFILSYLLRRFEYDGWDYLKIIFLAPGQYFDYHSAWYFLINGFTMLAIGLLMFFSTFTNSFIDKMSLKITNASVPTT